MWGPLVAYLTLDSHYLAAITGLGQMLNSGQGHREPHCLLGEKELRSFEKLILALSESIAGRASLGPGIHILV